MNFFISAKVNISSEPQMRRKEGEVQYYPDFIFSVCKCFYTVINAEKKALN